MLNEISDLVDPKKFSESIEIDKGVDSGFLKNSIKTMITIRLVEQKLAKEKKLGNIGGPVHLGVGQEAIAVAISSHLRKSDRVFGAHRSHSHLLSMGSNLKSFFAEILGRSTGLSKGMGGSMHLWDEPNGFYGSVPIVAGTVPLALGAGLAAKMDSRQDISVAYLGDSAFEEGVVHECLNIASLMEIPIIFVVENNLFGSHMHISQRQAKVSLTRYAVANGIDCDLVDGNNVVQISDVSKKLINQARNNNKPGFIEAITYRWYGHVDWREDIDVGVNRSSEDLADWKKRDPIKRLLETMIKEKIITIDDYNSHLFKIENLIDSAWNEAINDPHPDKKDLLNFVYKDSN